MSFEVFFPAGAATVSAAGWVGTRFGAARCHRCGVKFVPPMRLGSGLVSCC
jgi:hypothetical protein